MLIYLYIAFALEEISTSKVRETPVRQEALRGHQRADRPKPQ